MILLFTYMSILEKEKVVHFSLLLSLQGPLMVPLGKEQQQDLKT